MQNNCRLEIHLLFAFRLLATATHSSGNSRRASHRQPHDAVAVHCPRPSHPPADELAPAMLDVAPFFPARGQVLLQPWINSKFYFIYTPSSEITYHLLLCHQVIVEKLEIAYCYAIKALPNSLSISLKNLEISNCEALKSLPKNDLPSSMLELHVLL
jgi:hypothetical protein